MQLSSSAGIENYQNETQILKIQQQQRLEKAERNPYRYFDDDSSEEESDDEVEVPQELLAKRASLLQATFLLRTQSEEVVKKIIADSFASLK